MDLKNRVINYLNAENSRSYKAFTWILFVFLISYLLLRAYFVEPLNDEVFSFFYFIETGVFWGSNAILDANNHLLNSLLGRWIYFLFGDDFFYLRLPNVIAFAFYFWGIIRFVKPIHPTVFKFLIVLGTTCIPFILEYFAYSRGYGLSLGAFVFSLSYVRDFMATRSVKSAYISTLLITLAVYANLNFILTFILLVLLLLLIQWIFKDKMSKRQHLFMLLNYVLLLILMVPIAIFSYSLKNSGALYYGSLDGLWKVTGKTLSKNILFYDGYSLKYIFILIILLVSFYLIYRWRKVGNSIFFTESSSLLAWFLFGNGIAIVLMAELLKVNYPQDRVGMHLAVLFILLIGFILSQRKVLKWLLFGLLFFPISFIPTLSLSTSVSSQKDRIPKEFFNDVNEHIDSYTTISMDPIHKLTWSYHSRQLESSSFILAQQEFNTLSDVVLAYSTSFTNQDYPVGYKTIAHDSESSTIAFKRKLAFQKEVIFSLPFETIDSRDEFISIFNSDSLNYLRNRKLQFHATAEVTAENKELDFATLVYSVYDKDLNNISYIDMNQRLIHGKKKKFFLNFNYVIDQLDVNTNDIRIYLWNPKRERISLENGVFEILELTD